MTVIILRHISLSNQPKCALVWCVTDISARLWWWKDQIILHYAGGLYVQRQVSSSETGEKTHTQRRGPCDKEEEARVPKSWRRPARILPRAFGGRGPAGSWVSGFWSPQLREDNFCFSSPQVCDNLLQQPQEMNTPWMRDQLSWTLKWTEPRPVIFGPFLHWRHTAVLMCGAPTPPSSKPQQGGTSAFLFGDSSNSHLVFPVFCLSLNVWSFEVLETHILKPRVLRFLVTSLPTYLQEEGTIWSKGGKKRTEHL